MIDRSEQLPAEPACYRLYGLSVASALHLPELPARQADGAADVVVGIVGPGTLPSHDTALAKAGDGVLLTVPGTARYLIRAGREILVEPAPGAAEEELRLYLLGTAFGVLLHQRAILPLHANAVVIGGRAALFLGPSGSGKSTLTMVFGARGHPLLADDVSAVTLDVQGVARVEPGVPRIRLLPDAMARFAPGGIAPGAAGSADKVVVAMAAGCEHAVPAAAIYLLRRREENADGPLLRRLGLAEATAALVANTYRGKALPLIGNVGEHWDGCVRLARSVPMFAWVRDWGHDYIRVQADAVAAHFSHLAGRAG